MNIPTRIQSWVKALEAPPLLILAARENEATSAADWVGQRSVCTATDVAPCGYCRSCAAASEHSHPDIYELDASVDGSIKGLKQTLSALGLRTTAPVRVVVLKHVHELSLPAVQALLKPLEEPAHRTRFVLTAPSRHRVLPTIVSRCVTAYIATSRVPKALAQQFPNSTFELLKAHSAKDELTAEQLEDIAVLLEDRMRHEGWSPHTRAAMQRLRDYHVTAAHNGNLKAARDTLLAALPQPT